MTEHYDALETRDPESREADLFARLPGALRKAMVAPAYAERLKGEPHIPRVPHQAIRAAATHRMAALSLDAHDGREVGGAEQDLAAPHPVHVGGPKGEAVLEVSLVPPEDRFDDVAVGEGG